MSRFIGGELLSGVEVLTRISRSPLYRRRRQAVMSGVYSCRMEYRLPMPYGCTASVTRRADTGATATPAIEFRGHVSRASAPAGRAGVAPHFSRVDALTLVISVALIALPAFFALR